MSNHVEHIYTKLGVTSSAAATLFATEHGLLGPSSRIAACFPRVRPATDEANAS